MSGTRRVLVTGAAGYAGARIAAHLSQAGHHVLTTDITPHAGGLTGDLCDPTFRAALLHWADPDVVVHAAALVPLTRDEDGFVTTNVDASLGLAQDARRAGTERFVLIGSSAVYGIPRRHPITPTTRTRPIEAYGRSKLRGETATRDGFGERGLTILRPRTILGDGRRGIIDTLRRWIDDDLLIPLPRGGRHRLQLVHIDDLCRMVDHVIAHDIDGTWPVGAPGTVRFDHELTELIAKTGSRSRIVNIPVPLFRLAAGIADRLGISPFTRWHYATLGHDFAFAPSWTPPGFSYRYRNADVLASITTPTTTDDGTSPHTRTWKTGHLDRAVRALTHATRILRVTGRVTRILYRATRIIGKVFGRVGAWTLTRLAKLTGHIVSRNPGRPGRRPRLSTRLLLAPLAAHPDDTVRRRSLRSLEWHLDAGSTTARIGFIVAAQLARINGRGPLRWPIIADALRPVTDLAAKLRAAHVSAALAEPEPTPPSTSPRNAAKPTNTDLLVIGSGPGAAMLTHAARADGRDVLVLESGTRSHTPSGRHHTLEHLLADFAEGGAEICLAHPLTQIAQGRVLGGGSEVNSGFHHDLPAHHRRAWCHALGIPETTWLEAEAEVRSLLELGSAPADTSTSVIARGAAALGHEHAAILRWRRYDGENFTHHGMTRQIWERHPDVAVRTGETATRIEPTRTGLRIHLDDGGTINARRVAVCAGATGTPRLLHTSGIVDRTDLRFSLHPMVRIVAECEPGDAGGRDVDPYQAFGADGFKYGGAVSTPSLLGAALGRIVEPDECARLRSFYASFEPGGRGGFLPTPTGLLPWFNYSRSDRRRLHQGAENLHTLLLAAGVRPITGTAEAAAHPSSVHVFGSLPAGGRTMLPASSLLAADPRIAVYDASLLPTPIGVNPQAAVMTLSLILARRQLHL